MDLSKQFTYGAKERLKSRKLIQRLFDKGKSFMVFPFRVHYFTGENIFIPASAPVNIQCGVGASTRNFKKAVDRNRIKRLIREAWRLQKQPLVKKMEAGKQQLAIFIIYTGKELPDFNLAKEKLAVILNKLTTIIDEINTAVA